MSLFYTDKQPSEKSRFIWNMMGSTLTAGMSALLLLVVTRVSGDVVGGVFSIGFAIAQQMITIGFFDIRSFQVTDVDEQIRFNDYFSFRILSCFAMLICGLGYALFNHYSGQALAVTVCLVMLRMSDAFADVFQGRFQQKGRLDVAGKLFFARSLLVILTFTLVMIFTKILIAACISAVASSFIFIFLTDFPIMRHFGGIGFNFNFNNMKTVMLMCLPLFVSTFVSQYIGNAPKYAIQKYLPQQMQTYYTILFMFSFVINLCAEYILRPLLNNMADKWHSDDIRGFVNLIIKVCLFILIISVVAVAGAYLVGIPVLSAVYGTDLTPYRSLLVILVLGGGFYALGTAVYYAVTVIRFQQVLYAVYLVIAGTAFALSPIMVSRYALNGAAFDYLFLTFLRFALLTATLAIGIIRYRKKHRSET